MSGFINKIKKRVPGAVIKCRFCKRDLDEQNFSFSTSGYYSYCYECARKKSKEARDRDKLNLLRGIEADVNDADPFKFRRDIAHIKTCVRVGDFYIVNGQKHEVIYVTKSCVGLKNCESGTTETFIWVDMAGIVRQNLKMINEMKGG